MIDNPVLKDGDIVNVNSTQYTKLSRGLTNIVFPLRDIITAVLFINLLSKFIFNIEKEIRNESYAKNNKDFTNIPVDSHDVENLIS